MQSAIHWQPGVLEVDFVIDSDGHVSLRNIRPSGSPKPPLPPDVELEHALPLTQLRFLGEGSISGTSERIVFSAGSHRLRYVEHRQWTEESDNTHHLDITVCDPKTSLLVHSQYSVFDGIPVLRSTTHVENKGLKEVHLQSLAPLSLGYLNRGSIQWWDDYEIVLANSSNFREAQWQSFNFPDIGMDDCGDSHWDRPGTHAAVTKSNTGTFSTNGSLPMGALTRKDKKQCFMWQIESSGAWQWELGNILNGLYLVAGGPTDQHHQWTKTLQPGEKFTSVSTALAVVEGDTDSAFVPFTQYRRCIRRHHEDNVKLPIIFNDYMNCLKGNPTEERVTALIEPARKSGAEYFCIDAGWYSNLEDNWSSVGIWTTPSQKRFPSGFLVLLDKIRSAGMIPGVWIEPEVFGINCPAADELPDEAFFQRRGVRVVEQDRWQLDFRHPAVVARLDAVIDEFVQKYGIGYFKIDYNIDVTQGTDVNASSPGDGMFEHRRAYIRLDQQDIRSVPRPCAGNMFKWRTTTRLPYSTSDQQNPFLYSGISASCLTALTPEQSASWAYPQPEYSDDLNALCLVNSLMGRVHLSGRIDLLNERQLDLVVQAMQVYKNIRRHIADSLPFWPIGLPKWHDDWLALELRNGKHRYFAIWRRGGKETCEIPVGPIGLSRFETLFPRDFSTSLTWNSDGKTLSVEIPNLPSARLIYALSL